MILGSASLRTVRCLVLFTALAGCQTLANAPAQQMPMDAAVLQTDARSRDLYLSVIGQLIEYEKYHAALAHLEQFERLYGSTETSHRFKGDAWLALGQLSEAEREYTAVGSAAMSGYGSHGLGRVAAARDDWARALGYFEEAVRDQPTSANFLNDLGCALYRLGRVEEAEFQLQKALDLAPRNQQVSSNLDALRSDRLERLRPAGAVSGEAVP